MGLFGQNHIEEAVYRQMDGLADRVWGSPLDDEQRLRAKENRLAELTSDFSKIDDRAIRKARLKWIEDGRISIAFWRYKLSVASVRLPPVSSSLSTDSCRR